jgi:hypothetical protein
MAFSYLWFSIVQSVGQIVSLVLGCVALGFVLLELDLGIAREIIICQMRRAILITQKYRVRVAIRQKKSVAAKEKKRYKMLDRQHLSDIIS